MKKELRVLLVEDIAPDAVLINHELRRAGLRFQTTRVDSHDTFLDELEQNPPDVILSDHGVPGFDAFAALAEARSRCPEVPFIFVTGAAGDPGQGTPLRSGADDYVLKSQLHLLAPAIERALRNSRKRTPHRQLESALLTAEEQLHLLSQEVREYAAFMLTLSGRVASWNAAAERITGYAPADALDSDYERFLPEPEGGAPVAEPALTEVMQVGRREQEGRYRRRDGRRIRTRAVIMPLRGDGGVRGYLCVLQDLTPDAMRMGSERAAHQRALELEAANRELEEFTYAMALDLRAPLQHIESFAEMLGKSIGHCLDPKSRGYLKTISDSAHRISRLVDDLFTFSRIGQTEMYRLRLNLDDVVKEVVHDLLRETEQRQIEWIIHPLPEVEGDPVLLWLVFTNLLSNAVKFTRNRPAARVEVGGATTATEHILFVRDNGVGFDMHYADQLFGVFQRLHSEREFEGTGVGLANVRRIVQRHGGRVWAEGAVGEGAAFYVALPRGTEGSQ